MKNYTNILNEGFNSYFKKLEESKLNESWVIDTWGQVEEDPRDFAKEYDLGIEEIDLGTEHWSETSYKFTGSRENIERAINDGYFYSGNECSDDVADLIAANNLKGEALNEAVPRDLMSQIRKTSSFRHDQETRKYPWQEKGPNGIMRGNTDYIYDYQNSEPEEISASDVLRMKKNGEDLDDIYVLTNSGRMIKLDREGHPNEYGSTEYIPRINQSLKTTLKNANKIYKGNIQKLKDTQPEKFAARIGNPDEEMPYGRDEYGFKSDRAANFNLGAERNSSVSEYKRGIKKYQDEVKEIKAEYENGNISRKEMERQIEIAKRWAPSLDTFLGRSWSTAKEERAEDRYVASNRGNNVRKYNRIKYELADANYDLNKSQEKLDGIKSGNTKGWGYGDNAYYKEKVADIQAQIERLQKELKRYNDELAKHPESDDIAEFENEVAEAKARIDANQAEIDKLLRRNKNESLKRKSNKRLNEARKRNGLISSSNGFFTLYKDKGVGMNNTPWEGLEVRSSGLAYKYAVEIVLDQAFEKFEGKKIKFKYDSAHINYGLTGENDGSIKRIKEFISVLQEAIEFIGTLDEYIQQNGYKADNDW